MLFTKIKKYIYHRFILKNIDNKYWELADNYNDKVTTLFKELITDNLNVFYPGTDLEKLKKENPVEYKFLTHKLTRYIYKINDCLLDPDYNWVIFNKKQLFRYSYPLIEDPWDGVKPRPSVAGYFLRKKPIVIEKAILVKYSWSNYYHFLIDSLAQVYMCDDFGLPLDIPIIVPHNFHKISFVADYLKEFPLKRQIIVQEKGQYLNVKELYVAKDIIYNNYVHAIRDKIIKKDVAKSVTDVESPELLFISRTKGIYRSITNIDELEQIARENGFTVIEPINFTWQQQVKLLSRVKKLIGVHGAGLTNIMFCYNPDLKVLELFPGNHFAPEHYASIARQLHFNYDSILGDGLDANRQFHIDNDKFVAALKKLMQ